MENGALSNYVLTAVTALLGVVTSIAAFFIKRTADNAKEDADHLAACVAENDKDILSAKERLIKLEAVGDVRDREVNLLREKCHALSTYVGALEIRLANALERKP